MEFGFYRQLLESSLFQDWKKKNKEAYLTHFYCSLDEEGLKGNWEVGFYQPGRDKLTVFVAGPEIKIRPEEEVFKEESTIKELPWEAVTVSVEEAWEKFWQIKEYEYPREVLTKGFLILQFFQEQALWNISYAVKSLRILNVKVNAVGGKVISHQLINFIEQLQKKS